RRCVPPDTAPAVQVHLQRQGVRRQPPKLLAREAEVVRVPVRRGVAGVVVVRHKAVLHGAAKRHRVHVCRDSSCTLGDTQGLHGSSAVTPLYRLPLGPAFSPFSFVFCFFCLLLAVSVGPGHSVAIH
ncbi:hypothetical protein TraAM80_09426, partial [Trypanosoma rangeli]